MDFTKKGTKFKLEEQKITHRVVSWKDEEPSLKEAFSGEWQTFGTRQYKGQTWVLFDCLEYGGKNYWSVPLDELNAIFNKTIEKTMKKITAIKAKKFPVSELKTGMEFSSTQLKGQIVLQGNNVFIVHNVGSREGGRPSIMPKGFKYGWNLGYSVTHTDLTYGGQFSNIQLGGETTEKTAFKNSFVVTGSPALIKAFKEEAIVAGWTFKGPATSATYKAFYFCHKGDEVYSGAHFRLDGEAACAKKFSLPAQWDLAVKAVGEKEKEKLEYLKFNVNGQEAEGLVKGRTYKITKTGGLYAYMVIGDNGENTGVEEGEYVPGTKAEFDSQKAYVGHIGGFKVNIQTVKIRGYNDMKVACIGCKDSEQVYTVGALETLRDVMNSKGLKKAENNNEGVEFTIEQVEALLEACE